MKTLETAFAQMVKEHKNTIYTASSEMYILKL